MTRRRERGTVIKNSSGHGEGMNNRKTRNILIAVFVVFDLLVGALILILLMQTG